MKYIRNLRVSKGSAKPIYIHICSYVCANLTRCCRKYRMLERLEIACLLILNMQPLPCARRWRRRDVIT